jgi:hypothetical protein
MLKKFVLCSLLAGLASVLSPTNTASAAEETLVYELRTYTCLPGRLPALHARFKDHTMKLFEKHGMKNLMYWTPEGTEDVLVYVIAHKSREAADASWKAFIADPEWHAARDASEKDGKIVMKVERQYLTPTEYSPMK